MSAIESPVTVQGFRDWLAAAACGERLTYHQGHLSIDRARPFSSLAEPLRRELSLLADVALNAATEGEVLLVQHRIDDGRTAYLAIKAVPSKRA